MYFYIQNLYSLDLQIVPPPPPPQKKKQQKNKNTLDEFVWFVKATSFVVSLLLFMKLLAVL